MHEGKEEDYVTISKLEYPELPLYDSRHKVKIVCSDKKLSPIKAHSSDAGYDLMSAEENYTLKPMERRVFNTGIKIALPDNFEAQIRPRSGNALKLGITVLNTPGTIDCSFRGDIGVILINLSDKDVEVKKYSKIAQMIIKELPQVYLEYVETLDVTERNEKGYGSTGTI